MIRVRASNPLSAMWIGLKKTGGFIYQTYMTIERMIISRTVGIEKVSGPVGIVKMGSEIAHGGITKLLYFLGFLSATLAVINFLPLPIVDGGLLIFLIIEKIKGRPVNLKLQMVTQLIGLVLIIVAFVAITLQDIIKWND
jgi:regulator of sigma E protease